MSAGNTATPRLKALGTPGFPESSRSACCGHEVQFYSRDEYLIEAINSFIAPALNSGNSAIVVATKAHRDALAHRLEAGGVALAAAVEQGRYIARDAAETLSGFMIAGVPDRERFNDIIGDTILRATSASRVETGKTAIFGEMVALLWREGNGEAAIRLEQLWNELSETRSFDLLCGYPLAGFNRAEHREAFSQICAEHSSVIPAESLPTLADENDRLRIIALLQQAELALQTEALERRLAEARTTEIQSQNRDLLQQVRTRESAEDELRRFARRLLTSRDEEQRRIARELHENMAQLLAALSLYFGVLQEENGGLSPRVSGVVDSSRAAAQTLLKEVRKLSYLLHPPTLDEMGLAPALREYVEQFAERNHARVELEVSPALPRLPRRLEIAVFRIVEEALTNLHLDSVSPSAKVRLSCSAGEVLIEIQHRSAGILGDRILGEKESALSRLGIMGMRERARDLGGAVSIQANDQGTSISIALPTGTPPVNDAQRAVA